MTFHQTKRKKYGIDGTWIQWNRVNLLIRNYMKMDQKTAGGNSEAVEEESRSSLFNLDIKGLSVLLTKGLDLNHLYLLEQISRHADISSIAKAKDWRQTLIRKGFLTDEITLTKKGEQLFDEIWDGEVIVPQVFAKEDDPFEKWWSEAYPRTDAFEYKGKKFPGMQKKHFKKDECRKEYLAAINETKLSHEDIYWATICNVEEAKELSLVKGYSQIHYIPNSRRYLELRFFEPFIEAGRIRRNEQTTPSHNKKDPFNFSI